MEILNSERFLSRLGSKARVRYYCPVLRQGKNTNFSDIAFAYAETLSLTGIPFRILPNNRPSFLNDESDRWYKLSSHFNTEQSENQLLNIVCGQGDQFSSLYTDKYVNVAITAPFPRAQTDSEIEALSKYQQVWIPTWNLLNKCPESLLGRCKVYHVKTVHDSMGLFMKETVALELLERIYQLLG